MSVCYVVAIHVRHQCGRPLSRSQVERGGERHSPFEWPSGCAARANPGEQAGRWRRQFAKRGVTLSQADCLAAAAALGVGARLATSNLRDFPMKGLVVDHWPVGA